MDLTLLKQCREFLATIPDEEIKLATWVDTVGTSFTPGCGTIACAAGWLTGAGLFPGLHLIPADNSRFGRHYVPWNKDFGIQDNYGIDAARIFWCLAGAMSCSYVEAEDLFSLAGKSRLDPGNYSDFSDKELVIARFDSLVDQYEKVEHNEVW